MTNHTGVQVPEAAVEAAMSVLGSRGTTSQYALSCTRPQVQTALAAALPAIYEDFKERQARAIDAVPSYSDEQIAARRGPMKHWLDVNDIFAALAAAFPNEGEQ